MPSPFRCVSVTQKFYEVLTHQEISSNSEKNLKVYKINYFAIFVTGVGQNRQIDNRQIDKNTKNCFSKS